MQFRGILIAAMLLIAPTAVFAARGVVTDEVAMRAGPGRGFPVVDRLPAGSHVVIHGCLRDNSWCDVSWDEDRGWVSAEYLEYYFRNRYVYLPDYVDVIDVPVVPFVLGRYWSNHYASRPFFHRRAHWNNYWQSHARFATRPPRARSRGVAVTEGRGAIREGRGARAGFANERALHEGQAARVNGARGAVVGDRQHFIGRERGDRFVGQEREGRFSAHPRNAARANGREMTGHRGEAARTPFVAPQRGAERAGHFAAGPGHAAATRADGHRFGGANAASAAGRFGGAPAARVGGVPSGRAGGPPLNAQAAAPRAMAAPHPGGGGGAPHMGGAPSIGGGGARAGGGAPAAAAAAGAGGSPGRHR